MLILTRYNNQRIVVIAPDGTEAWIKATQDGVVVTQVVCGVIIDWYMSYEFDLSGQTIVVTHLETRGKSKPIHRIGIDAPKDYLILREELLNRRVK